jgi:hypothetical protein
MTLFLDHAKLLTGVTHRATPARHPTHRRRCAGTRPASSANRTHTEHRLMATSKTARPASSSVAASRRGTAASVAEAAAIAVSATRAARAAASRDVPAAPSLTAELNNIDFQKMIGGPLQAAVDAQVKSSMATVNFINEVGFTTDENGAKELVMVDFTHTKKDVDADGNEVVTENNIKVPLLAMLQIPSLRIEHVIIDFNVKLNSVQTATTSDKLGISAEVGGGFGPVNFKVSASYQRQSATGVEVKKEYALNVNVKAVQDEIPAGLEKILGMLSA